MGCLGERAVSPVLYPQFVFIFELIMVRYGAFRVIFLIIINLML